MLGWILIGALVVLYWAAAHHYGVASRNRHDTGARSVSHRLVRIREAWRRTAAEVRELEERRALLDRPWEEDFLHWAHGEDGWELHGHRIPKATKRTRSVTSNGWCPGLARKQAAQGSDRGHGLT